MYDRALATYPVATNAAQAGLMSFASALGLLRGQSLESIVATVSSVDQFWVALVLASNKVWLPAKVFMYGFLPARYWGLWCAVVSFVWGIILAVIVV